LARLSQCMALACLSVQPGGLRRIAHMIERRSRALRSPHAFAIGSQFGFAHQVR
jgi:hypothetical protein